jgi:hypothetical protein
MTRFTCLFKLATATALACACATVQAQDRAVIDPTVILGNRELPKVLYIVPWKKPLVGELSGRPLVSVVDEALAPIDRDVFRRQLQYQSQQQVRQKEAQQQAQQQAQLQAQQEAQAAAAILKEAPP